MFCESCQFSGICLFSTMRRHGAVEHLPQTMGQEGALSQFRAPRLFFQMSGHTTYVSVLFPHHLTDTGLLHSVISSQIWWTVRSLENHTLYVSLLLSDLRASGVAFIWGDQSSNPLSICWPQGKWLVLAIRVCPQLFRPFVPITWSGLRCHP